MQPSLRVLPTDLRTANMYVRFLHRHHKPAIGHRFSLAVSDGEAIRGVAIIGRPVSRHLDNGATLEVTRVATDGCPNACSALYAAAARAARKMGYRRIITYTLATEPGTSLRAAGWQHRWTTRAESWSREKRQRAASSQHMARKHRWEKDL